MEKKKINTTYLIDFRDYEFRKAVKAFAANEGISVRQLVIDTLKEKIGYTKEIKKKDEKIF